MLVSKAVGFIREMVIAYHFGTAAEYDIYLVAVAIPIALFALISGLSNLFIPVYAEATAAKEPGPEYSHLWKNFNLMFVLAVVLTAGIIAFAHSLIHITAPGFTAEQVNQATKICRVASIIILFSCLETFFRSALNSEKKFYLPAAGPIAANIVFISFVVFFSKSLSTYAILAGLVCGYFIQMLLVLAAFRSCLINKYFTLRVTAKTTNRFFYVAVVIVLVETASQLYTIIDRYFASSMHDGVISALGYTYILFMLPVSIFAYALSTAIFPYLTDSVVQKDRSATGALLTRGISVTMLLALPVSMLFWVFAREIVVLVFQRGAFDAASVTVTSGLVRVFALGMVGQSLIWLMYRAFYAARQYNTLLVNIIIAIVVKVALAYLLFSRLAELSLAYSSSISYSVSALFLVVLAGFSIAPLDWKAILRYVIKLSIITAIGAAVALYLQATFITQGGDFGKLLVMLPIIIAGTVIIMGIIAFVINIAEVREIVAAIYKRNK